MESRLNLTSSIKEIIKQYMAASDLTDMRLGTVVQADPLQIKVSQTLPTLPASCFYLTENVIEKTIDDIKHVHKYDDHDTGDNSGGSRTNVDTQSALDNINIYINNKALGKNKEGKIIINKGLEAGDKVLMLKVSQGQMYIVLSKLY